MRARFFLAALCSLGCSSTVTNNAATSDAGRDAPVVPTDVAMPVDVGVDVPPIVDVLAAVDGPEKVPVTNCADAVDALAARLISPADGRLTCTVVVRFEHSGLRPIGYQYFCGRYANITDAQAAALASEHPIPYVNSSGLTMVNAAMPEDAYVFYASPGDFGGVAAVSRHLGANVFAASTVWGGRGDILYPTEWRDPAELGCAPGGSAPSAHGYDLQRGGELPASTLGLMRPFLENFGLISALRRGGSIFDVVMFPYFRTVGAPDELTAEWILIINAGWLE